jgi:threonine/homoserine/homoserine lactone efflux protein
VLAETPRWEQLLTLAPVFVVGIGVVIAVLILLVRAFADSIRDLPHKYRRLLWVGAVAVVGAVVLLTYLGVNLPKE